MSRPGTQELGSSYGSAYRSAKPSERSSVNTKFRSDLENLKSQLAGEVAALQGQLVDSAEDLPEKRRIRQQVETLAIELSDAADLLTLINKRQPEDDNQRVLGEANKLAARRRQIAKEAEALGAKYTAEARGVSKTLDAIRKLRIESDALNGESEKFYDRGCEAALAGVGMVGLVRGSGFLDDLAQLPSLRRGLPHWGTIATDDDRPPRPEVPAPVGDDWGQSFEILPNGSKRITSPQMGSRQDRERLAEIERQRGEREVAIASRRAWDRQYASED